MSSLDDYQERPVEKEPEIQTEYVRPPQYEYKCAYSGCGKSFRVCFPFPDDQKTKKYCCWSCQARDMGMRI